MNSTCCRSRLLTTLGLVLFSIASVAAPLDPAFTYQGRLTDRGLPAAGLYDLHLALYDARSGGAQWFQTVTNTGVAVSNGLFTTTLAFGLGPFQGAAWWLELGVRTNGGGAFAPLSPRQLLTPTPYALYATNAGNAQTATTALGVAANAVTAASIASSNITSAKIAPGQVVKSLNQLKDEVFLGAGTNISMAIANGNMIVISSPTWALGGNGATTPGLDFLGTVDNQPLELRVNGQRALRLEPGLYRTPNVIGGAAPNFVAPDVIGATIGGGGGGGTNDLYWASSNSVAADFGTIGGGRNNTVYTYAWDATIGGGIANTVQSGAAVATIGGGVGNTIQANAAGSTIGGGTGNSAGASYATVAGGRQNEAGGSYSLAAGRRAKALHTGSFVWADSTDADFASTGNNQFLIRATGGVGVNSPNLAGDLDVRRLGSESATLHIGGSAANGSPKVITFGDGQFVYVGENGSDDRLELRADTFYFNNGNVGIGTDSPSARLDVSVGDALVRGPSNFTPGTDARLSLGDGNNYVRAVWGEGLRLGVFNGTDAVAVQNGGNVGIGTTTPSTKLHVVGTVTATGFDNSSDRNAKENVAAVDSRGVLEKVVALPISKWNFKGAAAAPHLGPMAQDFHAAFGLGTDDKHIATVDADGVALAAIQGLNQKVEAENAALRAELNAKDAILQSLRQRLDALEQNLANHRPQ